jgi:hypothetical protein
MPPPMPFIVAAPRSGTMLLGVMLGAHPDMAISPKTGFYPGLAEACATAPDPHAAFVAALTNPKVAPAWRDWHIAEADVRRVMDTVRPFDLSCAIRALYGLLAQRMGKPRHGDRTPRNLRAMITIADILPEAHFIHIIRDGRAQFLSARKAGWGAVDPAMGARGWVRSVQQGRRQGTTVPHYIEVRYEDLVLSTERELRRLCRFLDLPWNPAMLDYTGQAAERLAERHDSARFSADDRKSLHRNVLHPPMASRIDAWRAELGEEDIRRFDAVAGDLLRELGHTVSGEPDGNARLDPCRGAAEATP